MDKYKNNENNFGNKIIEKEKEKIVNMEDETKKSSSPELKKSAEIEKIKGNDFMKKKEYLDAIKHYSLSLNLDNNEPTTYCNRSLAYIKIDQFENGIRDCNEAINIKIDYSKAYYRRALCYVGLKMFKEAFDDLILLLIETPNNKEIIDEINITKKKWIETVGKEEYKKIESDINRMILNANNGIKHDNENSKESKINKIKQEKQKFEERKIELKKEEIICEKTIPDIKKEFKKIKIIEEDTITQDILLEKKFETFWKIKNEIAKQFEELYKQEKFHEILNIAKVNLADCQSFLPELNSKSSLKSKLEGKILELNQFIQICTQKINYIDTTEKIAIEKNIKEEVEKVKKFYKTPSIQESKMQNATKIAENDMSFNEFPNTANGFEKAFSSFKKNNDAFYNYLSKFEPEKLVIIFEKIEMSYDLVVGIINCQKANGLKNEDSFKLSLRYLIGISKTKKFNLMKSFLKGPVRDGIKLFIEEAKLKYKFIDDTSNILREIDKAYFN